MTLESTQGHNQEQARQPGIFCRLLAYCVYIGSIALSSNKQPLNFLPNITLIFKLKSTDKDKLYGYIKFFQIYCNIVEIEQT